MPVAARIRPVQGFAEVAMDRFDAASVLRGKLCGALLAFVVALPKGIRT